MADEGGQAGDAWGTVPPPPFGGGPAPAGGGGTPPAPGDYPGGTGWHDLQGTDPGTDPDASPFPSKRRRFRLGTVLRLGVLAVVAIGALIGWLGSADRDQDGAITKPGELAAIDLRVGDCFDNPAQEGEEVEALQAVPCDEPHDNEVFHEFKHADGDAPPASGEVSRRVAEECVPAFDAFVGFPYQDSALDFYFFEPTVEGWGQGDRTVQCVIFEMDGSKLAGTARGARR